MLIMIYLLIQYFQNPILNWNVSLTKGLEISFLEGDRYQQIEDCLKNVYA